MKENPITRDMFVDVYSVDELHGEHPKGKGLITNSSRTHEAGEHWWAIYNDGKSDYNEFFCSYALSYPDELSMYLGPNVITNTQRIQSFISSVCGQYCMFFLYKRAAGFSYNDIINCFDEENHLLNDLLVNREIEDIFGGNVDVFYPPHLQRVLSVTFNEFMERNKCFPP